MLYATAHVWINGCACSPETAAYRAIYEELCLSVVAWKLAA